MNYHKTLVVDIDDTISSTTNRDWENAIPNTQLINKLNRLFNEGWEIHYYTARGNVSFNSRAEADNYYRPIIENWFKKHNVKYTALSFNKILAAYYIDDKAIRPDEFLELEIEELVGGLSGATIERRGNKVYKTHKNSLDTAVWFKEAENIIKTVKVHSLIGDTICLDYIEKTDEPMIEQIEYIIDKFSKVPSKNEFCTYIERIQEHLNIYNPEYKDLLIEKLKKYENKFNQHKSFCHGDMSLDNMINNNGILYLIDPNKPKDLYSSYLLDISKILHSARRFDKTHIYDYFINKYKDLKNELILLEITHWVRMRKYENNILKINRIDDIINILIQEI